MKTCDYCKEAEAVRRTPNGLFSLCDDCYYGLLEDKLDGEKEDRIIENAIPDGRVVRRRARRRV